jgi:hypothetical protein
MTQARIQQRFVQAKVGILLGLRQPEEDEIGQVAASGGKAAATGKTPRPQY